MAEGQSGACWRCGAPLPSGRLGRRDACARCDADLHCCRNCRFYDPPRHNECREPQAERQVDKKRGNFCEYFGSAASTSGETADRADARARLEALFARPRRR
ncbi:MAG: hypothetical protein AB7V27_13310 [Candidatus Binatia bacterium]